MTAPAGQTPEGSVAGAPVLEVKNLTGGYGRTVVLRDITLTVPASEVTALLGATEPARPPSCARYLDFCGRQEGRLSSSARRLLPFPPTAGSKQDCAIFRKAAASSGP